MSPRIVQRFRAWSPAVVQHLSNAAPEGVQKSNVPFRGTGLDSWTFRVHGPFPEGGRRHLEPSTIKGVRWPSWLSSVAVTAHQKPRSVLMGTIRSSVCDTVQAPGTGVVHTLREGAALVGSRLGIRSDATVPT